MQDDDEYYDSENDPDYNPNEDTQDNENEVDSKEPQLKDLSFSRKRRAAEAWEKLVTEDAEATASKMRKANRHPESLPPSKSSESNRLSKAAVILSGIFGKSEAAKLLGKSIKGNNAVSDSSNSRLKVTSNELKKEIESSLHRIKRKGKVEEVRKFAGKSIV
jgi:hypothetical protein